MTCFTSCETLELVQKHNYIEIFRCLVFECIFMARRAIPMIAFPRVRCMFIYIYTCIYIYIIYIYIYMFVSLTRVCVVYVVKEVTSFPGAWSINGRGA